MNSTIPSLPRPRGYVERAILVAVPVMLATILLWSLQAVLLTDVQFFKETLPFGLVASFHVGLIMGVGIAFFIRGETITVEFLDAGEFAARLDAILARLRYYPSAGSDHFRIYKPSWRGGILAGRISVRLFEECATIVGPRYYVRKLKERLEE